MEGYSGDASSEKKDDKSEKKAGKAAGLGSRTFEFVNKKDTAEKIAEASSLWEKLIPKDGGEKPKADSVPESKPDKKAESAAVEESTAEFAEEASDPSVENLSAGEKAEVIKDYVQGKKAELEAGRNDEEDPADAAAREANIEFLHELEADAEATPLEPVEEIAETPETNNEEMSEDAKADLAESEHGPAEFAHDEAIELNTPLSNPETAEQYDAAQQTSSAAVPPPPTSPTARSLAGSGGFVGSANFNAAPLGYNPNTAPTTSEKDRESNEGAYFLAGGIIGYLLGRRRGRIKTEKRMKAVTKKLEKQVKETRDQVMQQEFVIRKQARDRYNQAHRARSTESLAARTETRVRPEAATGITPAESKASGIERQAVAERVQHMNHNEVLAMAEKVVINGTSLRTIYEAKQITEPGLRRITREYLTGGDVKAALQQELKVKEMQYERDPQMRDRLAASYAGVDAAQPQAAKEALATLLAQNETVSPTSVQTKLEPSVQADDAAKKRGQQALVSAWAALIVVLVIIAVVLAMR